jgi:mono/diheme cytochrome c family protein
MLAIVFAGTSLGDSKAEDVDFQKRIAPILSARCVGCHQPGKTKGGLDLTSASAAMKGGDSGPSWTIGNSSDSEIVARITPEEPGAKADMPRQGEALTAAEIVLISK